MIRDLVLTYLTAKGFKRIKGSECDASPILPLIMMDSAGTWFDHYIKNVPCSGRAVQYRSNFEKSRKAVFKEFFNYCTEDQRDELIDFMDGFEAHIAHDAEIVFWQFTNVFKEEPFETQKIMSAALMVSIFCQAAQIVYGRVFKNKWGVAFEERNIKNCETWIVKWKNAWYNGAPYNCNESEMISQAVSILCRKMVNFLREIYEKELTQ